MDKTKGKKNPKHPCLRCGRSRMARKAFTMCSDCKSSDPWFKQRAMAS